MQEGITLRAYVNEAGIESGHEFAHTAQVDVTNGVAGLLAFLVLVFYQILVFEKRNRNLLWLNINDEFTSPFSFLVITLFFYFKGAYLRSLETSLVHSFHLFSPSELTCSYDDSCAVSSCACE